MCACVRVCIYIIHTYPNPHSDWSAAAEQARTVKRSTMSETRPRAALCELLCVAGR